MNLFQIVFIIKSSDHVKQKSYYILLIVHLIIGVAWQ